MAQKQDGTAKVFAEIEQALGQVPDWFRKMPEPAMSAFWGMMRDFQLAETKIPSKYKELIGIAVSGATRCRYCALFHTEAARMAGATDEEISEASAMAGLTMYGSTYLNAMQTDYDQFARETREIVEFVKRQQAQQGKAPQAAKGARVS
ncbi:MAG: carboxymuconolactone decarboxylase family protein [Deltaproteobacteria bacterium]|nr:carboxymuconolactone decarboxylase family protein [Deltaproteobacteria bacterium]